MEIVISKSQHWLEVRDGARCLQHFPVGIGREPGHKQREGDLKTPEGVYAICVKNPRSKYFLSLGLNYPNLADADRGLADGRIGMAEHSAIVEAHRENRIPPWKTALGGEIYIHGHLEKQAWSHGCIRVNDADMRVLYDLVHVGTKVTLLP